MYGISEIRTFDRGGRVMICFALRSRVRITLTQMKSSKNITTHLLPIFSLTVTYSILIHNFLIYSITYYSYLQLHSCTHNFSDGLTNRKNKHEICQCSWLQYFSFSSQTAKRWFQCFWTFHCALLWVWLLTFEWTTYFISPLSQTITTT